MVEGLNNRQSEAVLCTKGPLLILAGAGSGKTRVITNRIAYLIEEKGVSPKEILAITFTNKAAAEMRERIEAMLGISAGGAWISTFHSMCVRILRMHAGLLGYDTNFTIYDTDDSKAVVKNACIVCGIDTKQFKEKWFMGQISSAKDKLIGVDKFELDASGDYYLERVAKVYREYQRELKRNNAFDFDDLIVKTVELFRKFPEVLDLYQERFRYISVDEYQDTNMAQFELVRLLADKYKNICVVGDDDQSIYKFRGANVENILSFEKVFPGAKVIRLEQNYRSTKNILDAANAVIKNNKHRKSKSLWTEQGEGAKITFYHVDNPYVEADRVIDAIIDFKSQGFSYKDCACLYRTNAQSRNLEEAFIRENIPYKIVGGINFYQRKEIKDVLAYLKTIDNARDDIAVKRIINVPKRSIGKTSVDAVQRFADDRGLGFYSALVTGVVEGVFGRAGDKLKKFTDIIEELREVASRAGAAYDENYGNGSGPDALSDDMAGAGEYRFYPDDESGQLSVKPGRKRENAFKKDNSLERDRISLLDLMEDVLDKTGYMADLKAEKTDEAEARIENIEELINKLAIYEETNDHPTLSGFLEEVALIADIDSWDADENYVSLITVHSAKGLEFPNVFLCGMEDGLFPMNASIASDDPSDLEEERRLAYVAITRAKKNLIITASKMRMVRGETMISLVSRFVKEIPEELLEKDRRNIRMAEKAPEDFEFGQAGRNIRDNFKRKPFGFGGSTGSSGGRTGSNGGYSGTDSRNGSGSDYGTSGRSGSRGYGTGFGSLDNGGYGSNNKSEKKQFEVKNSEGLEYGVGDRVSHIKFGEGTVLSIDEGGRDYEVTVDFEDFGVKKMFAAFAKLKKI